MKSAYFESHFDRYPTAGTAIAGASKVGRAAASGTILAPHLLDQVITSLWSTGEHDRSTWHSYGLAPSPPTISTPCCPGRSGAWCCTAPCWPRRKRRAYIVHGSRGSYVKYGLDPQEERLKSGERLPQEDWGYDMRDGAADACRRRGTSPKRRWLTLPGNYPAYYAAIRDALEWRSALTRFRQARRSRLWS